jgi:hypothetical protein
MRRSPSSFTDVRPLDDGQWLATCDCGQSSVQPDQPAGWTWVLGHDCPID